MIEATNLTKRFGQVHAVHDVSFSVGKGEIVGLLGPNGAGKTTIMKILTGYHYPTAGTVTVNGHDVCTDPVAVKSSIGYLPENAPLYDDLTVREYLDFIADARRLTGRDRANATARALKLCGLGAQINRPIDELSKGFRQRVGLAQAILHDPSILILDEPTTGLDPNQIQEIRHLIRTLGSEKTVILSTHILQEVEAMCDRVLILNEGEIAASGTTEEIGRELKGETVFTVQIAGGAIPAATRRALEPIGRCVTERLRNEGAELELRVALAEGRGGEDLFRWAVDNHLTIGALVPERYSLEEIFTRLTATGDLPAGASP
ncbi:MAG: ATP-binding cassette domain-containing protein [Spirochaetia bacterium]